MDSAPRPALRRAGQVRRRRPACAPVEQLRPGGEHRLAGAAGGRPRRADRGAAARAAPVVADRGPARRRVASTSGSPARRPSRRPARAAPGASVSAPVASQIVGSNGRAPALPVQVTCRPSRPPARPGSTTSARSVDRGLPHLQADQEADPVRAPPGPPPGRPGRPGRRRRPRSARQLAAGGRGQDPVGVAAGRGRQQAGPRPRSTSLAGAGVADRPAAGQQRRAGAGVDRAALAGPPRHPGQPRAGASAASRAAAVSSPGTSASRSPTRTDRARLGSARRAAAGRSPSAPASSPGTVRHQRAPSFVQPGRRERRDRVHRQPAPCGAPCAAAGRRSGTPPPARGRPAPPPAPPPLGVRHEPVSGRARPPGRRGSRPPPAECGRARKSMSLVPSATRANFAYAYASSTVSRPPVSTPTPSPRRGPRAAPRPPPQRLGPARLAQLAGARRPAPAASVSRSAAVAYWKPHRPLSQFHSSLTAGSSPASRRITLPRRWSVRSAQPDAQCSHTLGVETRSNGRARNRYCAPVSAPDRADLHGVAGEVGVERLVLGSIADLLQRAAAPSGR